MSNTATPAEGPSTEDRIRTVASKYADTSEDLDLLVASALRRLEYRKAHSGKRCPSCENDLPVSSFGPDGTRPDGLARICRPCDAERHRPADAEDV
ncbi:hypothetical protein SEA_VROOMVROOM_64 [Arthrobacter phage VroomVroom]|uniref:HNH endonuclease n=1 Tax=Arthrobacter phage VroomVroom TaxID=3049371 RepID=A0AA49FAE8_9CAUD|nr:hypothetical protein SEA_VROOMVROOM_64 [Arthrobacter phage VroomVroom]